MINTMDLKAIRDAFDRVTKKQKLSSSKSQEVMEQIQREFEQALTKLQSSDDSSSQLERKSVLTELSTKLKEISPLSQLEGTLKELNVALSKYPKLLEKSLNPDICKAYKNMDFDVHTINTIIATHFYRQGLFEIGDCFISEANEPVAAAIKLQFLELYHILSALTIQNLEPALSWATTNHEKLREIGSDLELKLHRLQFIEILRKGNRDDALKYARTFLSPFASTRMAEIQKLMALLLWVGKLDHSPYAELLSTTHWDKLAEEVTRQFCNLLGQSYESPLSVTIEAGVQAWPQLLKMMNVMVGKKQDWQSMKQLPVPLDLYGDFQFHSIFVCPVSRDQATEDNPPMLMSCGHVLCRQSIVKMSKNRSRSFKCPYCPSDIQVAECRQLYF